MQSTSSGGESDQKDVAAASAPPTVSRSASASRIPRARSSTPRQARRTTDSNEALAPESQAKPSGKGRTRRSIKPPVPRQGRPGQRSGEPAGKGIEQGHADTAAAVERRSRANLVRALNLLRCIKAVIEGLPPAEAEAVLSPGADVADTGAVGGCGGMAITPITQVMSKIDSAYKEAHGAALSLRSNMETALQTVASMQLPQGGGGDTVDPAVWLKVLLSCLMMLLYTRCS